MILNRRSLLCAVAVLVVAAGLAPLNVAEDCKSTVSSELRGKQEKETVTSYVFKVDVTTEEACADIDYALTTTEQLPGGEKKVFETPGKVRLRNGSTSQKLTYDLKKENQMVDWKIQQTGCTRCEP